MPANALVQKVVKELTELVVKARKEYSTLLSQCNKLSLEFKRALSQIENHKYVDAKHAKAAIDPLSKDFQTFAAGCQKLKHFVNVGVEKYKAAHKAKDDEVANIGNKLLLADKEIGNFAKAKYNPLLELNLKVAKALAKAYSKT